MRVYPGTAGAESFMPPSPIEAVEMRALAGRLVASLGAEGADQAHAAGRLMSLDASLAEAGALLGLPPV